MISILIGLLVSLISIILPEGRNVWLNFRGINYKAEIFLNGKRINRNTHEGMFLRKTFNITPYLRTDAPNVLAVLVYPPTHAGKIRMADKVAMGRSPGIIRCNIRRVGTDTTGT